MYRPSWNLFNEQSKMLNLFPNFEALSQTNEKDSKTNTIIL